MDSLTGLFPNHVQDGVFLRPDGVAVTLIGGGAPAWELLSDADRAHLASEYHRLLLSLDTPLDVYMIDAPVNLSDAIELLLDRQRTAALPVYAAVLGELADRFTETMMSGQCRAKRVVWALSSEGAPRVRGMGDLSQLTSSLFSQRPTTPAAIGSGGQAAIATALERGRRFRDGLARLGANPPPRLLTAREIVDVMYQLADPVRNSRYPLAGTLLERVQRVIAAS